MPDSVFTAQYRRFTKMLIEARNDAGLTQEELAERIRWQQTDISKVERGERKIDVVEFLQFTKAIGVDAAEFVRQLQ